MARNFGGIMLGAKPAPSDALSFEEEQAAARAQREKAQIQKAATPTSLEPASKLLQRKAEEAVAVPDMMTPITLDESMEKSLRPEEIRGLKAEQQLLNRKTFDPEIGARPITPEDIRQQQEALKGIEPSSLQETAPSGAMMDETGRATDEFASNILSLANQRKEVREASGQPSALAQPIQPLRNNIDFFEDQSYKDRYDNYKKPIDNRDINSITSVAMNNVQRLGQEVNGVPLFNTPILTDELGNTRQVGDLFEETFPNLKESGNYFNDLQNVSLAMTLSGYKTVFGTHKQGLFNQDLESSGATEVNTEGMSFLERERALKNAENKPKGTLVKDTTNEDILGKVESGELAINQYEPIFNQAVAITREAKKILSKTIVPEEEDTYGRDAILGEFFLKQMIDRGEAGVYSFLDPRSKTKKYYVDIIPSDKGDKHIAETGYDMSYALDPTSEFVQLMSTVPTTSMGRIDATKWKPGKQTVLKKGSQETITVDEAVLSLLGSVARVVNPNMQTLLVNMFKQQDTTLGKEYFKLTDEDIEGTRRNAFERNLFKFLQQGDTEEEATRKAEQAALDEAEASKKIALQMISNELGLLNKRLNHKDMSGKQVMKFAEWLISAVNHRIQEASRDGQSSQKATIRMADGFAEKAYLTVDPAKMTDNKDLADKLNKILYYSPIRSKNGEAALEELFKLGDSTLQEMNTKIMWAITYLKLSPTAPAHTYFNGEVSEIPNIKRMTPDEILKYYADHEPTIRSELGKYANEVKQWVTPGGLPPLDTFPEKSWQAKVLERGEVGYHVTNILDIDKYNKALASGSRERIELQGIMEMDANNSNIAIQAVMGGDLQSAKILGIAFDMTSTDLKEWMDTTKRSFTGDTKNPDSFYIKLADNYKHIIPKQFSDTDRSEAMKDFFLNIIDKKNNIKTMTRDLVVSGFYGLHPSVNRRSVKDLLITFGDDYQRAMKKGGYKSEEDFIDDVLKVQGANFNSILGSISIAKDAKYLGALISLDGDFDPSFESYTGAIIKSMVNELGVASSSTVDSKLAPFIGKHEPLLRRNKEGKFVPVLGRNKTIADAQERFVYTEGGKSVKDVSKTPGHRHGDGIAAIQTHVTDAALEKMALLAQNKYREVAMPNIPIHDANKVNGVSYLQHWVSYNMIAIPSLLKEKPLLEKIYDKAAQTRKRLKKQVKEANGRPIFIGDSGQGKHRALMHLFDYMWKYNKPDTQSEDPDNAVDNFSNKRKAVIQKVLDEAAKLGWIPLDNDHPKYAAMRKNMSSEQIKNERENKTVSPKAFDELIDLAFELYGFGNDNFIYKGTSKHMRARIDKMKDNMAYMAKQYEAGFGIINSQNSG